MKQFDGDEYLDVREPECRGPATASSVTGVGPGAICRNTTPEEEPEPEEVKIGCRASVKSVNKMTYRAKNGGPSVKGC